MPAALLTGADDRRLTNGFVSCEPRYVASIWPFLRAVRIQLAAV
jgi:hypothetical protein